MAYVECKIWPFSGDIDHMEKRCEAMKEGHTHYTAKALIDTSVCNNFIRKNVADKLGLKYAKPSKNILKIVPNALGFIDCLDLSLKIKGEDSLVTTDCDDPLNDFVVVEEPKADLVFELKWLWLREAKIDIRKDGIRIYGKFVPFLFKDPNTGEFLPEQSSRSKLRFDKQIHEVSSVIYPKGTK
ncbi:uncharacterized protein OCT59_028498 [Rhizophagus irregularis]|uniref:Uncharacterized protein n=2 Tax=Rhizophagus irregularis TaxID=588596 RepID=A0A015KMS8_RHIIW|nr:hypothetical protein RirG_101500 [Rhizophagus irregularis DAOM 197198w]EXX68834.1 hypothetical protein RirG_101530 [Rhizophagus irregularis DAOM 197198w]UZO08240.1 hypothetical protein OCT59_028498 [Rhizophagus irregularis]GBC52967.2 hypothetical protein GLOIN_2v1124533 [Rhizophagus irregularis DAOM 181602=DAOM 197198]CAG8685934.1 15689_t:CDS:1 [Rhizophagus irregularis]